MWAACSLTGPSVTALVDFEIFLGVQYFSPRKFSNHDLYTPTKPSRAPMGSGMPFGGAGIIFKKLSLDSSIWFPKIF